MCLSECECCTFNQSHVAQVYILTLFVLLNVVINCINSLVTLRPLGLQFKEEN